MRMFMLMAIAALTAGAAEAQSYRGQGREPAATLYQYPNFQGRAYSTRNEVTNMPRDINDWARSGRFTGTWEVCEHSDFGGHCAGVSGVVRDFADYGLAGRISSLRPLDAPGGATRPGGGWSEGGWRSSHREPGIEGARTVFFPYPRINGRDLAAGDRSANEYCRANGLGSAVWYDSNERSNSAVDIDGRYVGGSTILRDLLCRRY